MNLLVINAVLLGHWLSDFVLQKNKEKDKRKTKVKNKNLKRLLPHTLIYSSIQTLIVYLLQLSDNLIPKYPYVIFTFFIVTYITHFLTDFTITKINVKHLNKRKRHKYFVTIGFDQYIHYALLALTIDLMYIVVK